MKHKSAETGGSIFVKENNFFSLEQFLTEICLMSNDVSLHFSNLALQQQQLYVVMMMDIDQMIMENKVYQLKEQIEIEHVYVIQHLLHWLLSSKHYCPIKDPKIITMQKF